MNEHDDRIARLQRRRRLWMIGFALAPLPIASTLPPVVLFIADGWPDTLGAAVDACARCALPVALGVVLASIRGSLRGPGAAFWPAIGGLLGGVPPMVWAAWNAASDPKGLGLAMGWFGALAFGALGAIFGCFLSFFRDLRFRLPCERALDALRCRRCGYSFAGLESPHCPECGARRPPT